MFSSAPWQGSTYPVATIPITSAGIYLLQNIFSFAFVRTINSSRESILSVLHQLYRLFVILYFHNTYNWAKRFFFHYSHLVIYIHQYSWFKKISFIIYLLSTGKNGGSFFQCISNLGL